MKIKISETLSLPGEFLTDTQAILAKKRVGKSYAAQVEAEELLEAGQQVVVLDPTDAWWGLRSSADGQSPGYPITILGGRHGDVPLEATAGSALAQAIVHDRFSAVVSLKLFTKGERLRFAADFLETLYRENREAMHLFVDEADVFAPQKTWSPEQARCLGAADELVRRGGIDGVGVTLISQRPQVVNKDVLSQVDRLVVLRMNHPKDIAAIKDWLADHVDLATVKQMLSSLPALPKGDAWVWVPGDEDARLTRVRVRAKRTFDSGRTPRAGERVQAPKVLAAVDLARLGETIAATVERARANDPKALRARVAELERQLAARAPEVIEKVREVPVVADAQVRLLGDAVIEASAIVGKLEAVIETARTAAAQVSNAVHEAATSSLFTRGVVGTRYRAEDIAAIPTRGARIAAVAKRGSVDVEEVLDENRLRHPNETYARVDPHGVTHHGDPGDVSLGSGERKILTVLARNPAGKTRREVAVFTGYTARGGTYRNYVGSLRSRGFVESDGKLLRITAAGAHALGTYEPLPTGRALYEYWLTQLGKAEREVLRVLYEEYPSDRPRDFIAVKAGYEAAGGSFRNAIGRLRTLDLITGKAKLRASAAFFEVSP